MEGRDWERKGGRWDSKVCCFIDPCHLAQHENPGVTLRCRWQKSSFPWKLKYNGDTKTPLASDCKQLRRGGLKSSTQSSYTEPGRIPCETRNPFAMIKMVVTSNTEDNKDPDEEEGREREGRKRLKMRK